MAASPAQKDARAALLKWASDTRTRLEDFKHNGGYAGLSHRLSKFYSELKDTANSVCPTDWRYGYILLVCTHEVDLEAGSAKGTQADPLPPTPDVVAS